MIESFRSVMTEAIVLIFIIIAIILMQTIQLWYINTIVVAISYHSCDTSHNSPILISQLSYTHRLTEAATPGPARHRPSVPALKLWDSPRSSSTEATKRQGGLINRAFMIDHDSQFTMLDMGWYWYWWWLMRMIHGEAWSIYSDEIVD